MACAVQPSAPYRDQMIELIGESKKLVEQLKEIEVTHYSSTSDSLDKHQRLERLTLRRNIFMRQAWVEWAEEALQELNSISS